MAKKESKSVIGSWAFLIGVVLAVVLGALGQMNATVLWILALIGIVIGLLNIADEEATPFLMSGAVLIIAASFGAEAIGVIGVFDRILQALLVIFVPATIIVAIRNVFSLARS